MIFRESQMQTDPGQKNMKYLSFLAFIEKTMLGLKRKLQSNMGVESQRKIDNDLKVMFENALFKQLQNPEMRNNGTIKNKIRNIIDKCQKNTSIDNS